jgi:prolyl-tRNA editing enzyme YbaK/EbsC (Cys-tRNA(Pro) deacylase)
MLRSMHRTALKLQQRLAERGLEVDVRVLPDSTRTAAEAAAACGCDTGQIVKSLVFVVESEPTIVLCAGDRRVERIDGRPRHRG